MIDFSNIATPFDGGACAADVRCALHNEFGLSYRETAKLAKQDKLVSTYRKMLAAKLMGQAIKPFKK